MLVKLSKYNYLFLASSGLFVSSSMAYIADFQKFDNQVALGINYTSATNGGQLYEGPAGVASVNVLLDSGFYYNGSLSYSNATSLSNNFGRAFSLGRYMQITPGTNIRSSHINSSSGGSEINTDVYSQQIGARYEVSPNENLNFYGLASYGLSEQSSNSSPLGYSGAYVLGAGLTYRPIASVPWVVNAGYTFNAYAGAVVGEVNQVSVSTGYAF